MKPYTYLIIDLGAFIIPFLFSFHPKLRFDKEWKRFFPALIFGSGIFLLWDVIFTKWGVWGFNPDYLCGIQIYNLPLEEVLFFICIPYACMYTYHCFRVFFQNAWDGNWKRLFAFSLATLLLTVGLIYINRLYTGVTFVSAALTLFFLLFTGRASWIGHFLITWGILQIPFLVVNGLLTGTGLEAPIVWYNDAENLGLRILTIPVEDTFYGMLLMLLITAVYERKYQTER